MENSEIKSVENISLSYIRANERLMDEYFVKLKETNDPLQAEQCLKVIRECKKNVLDTKKRIASLNEIEKKERTSKK